MKKIIIGNWKMNPLTLKEAQALVAKIDRNPVHRAVVCPPAVFLSQLDYPNLAAQDCFWQIKGPYTGQTSPATLKSLGVKYCLVGHSEKRALGETDQDINAKVMALQDQGITPVLCIGHGTTVKSDDLEVIEVIKGQLGVGLQGVDLDKVIVAYEPVWAIGTGKPATAEHAEKIAIYIKTKFNVATVIYGASSNSTNAEGFLRQPHIDGLLPGGASLLPGDFNKMINLAV